MKHLLARVADFFRETDKLLLILCVAATSYGCAAVFSTTYFSENLRPFIVQVISMFLGVGVAFFISAFDYERYLKRWYLFIVIGLIPVILTFFIGIGPEGTDDKAWLDFGITTFQPSELLKVCFTISFAAHIQKIKPNINKFKYLIPLCVHGAAPVLLIHLQGDDGTALVFAIMVLAMMFAAGVSLKYFAIAFSSAIVASPFIYFFVMNEDQRERIMNIFNIEADIQGIGYQQWRGRMALANGGLTGQGFLKGDLTQAGVIPEARNDFIFVSIGEELGLLGCLAVLILLGAICLRCIRIARICSNDAGKIICVGIFSMLFAQIIINVGMCTSILPVIGVTLPFFSAGGTSLACLYLAMGLVMNVYMHRNSRTIYLHD